jgi:hypothetical protein
MQICQSQFPTEYNTDSGDVLLTTYLDRYRRHYHEEYDALCKKFRIKGDLSLTDWFMYSSSDEVLPFLISVFRIIFGDFMDQHVWVGYRVLVSINKSNGYPYHYIELFHRGENSSTELSDGDKIIDLFGDGTVIIEKVRASE